MSGHFGFSYIGLIYLLMLFIPNGIWAKKQPEGYAELSKNENKALLVFERAGQVLVTASALIFSDYNPAGFSGRTAWLIVSGIFMLLYEAAWIRYFVKPNLKNFYGHFMFIPVPLASLPVFAFLLLGIYGKVIWLIISAVVLGIGHIGIHIQHIRTINKTKELSELSDSERAKLFPIILSGYNPKWAEWFIDERKKIEELIDRENIAVMSHIGSTAVPDLTAKPTVDILLEVRHGTDMEKIKAAFPESEYICIDRQTVPTSDILLFLKGYTKYGFANRVFHIHVRYEGDWDEKYFRDYLIAHPETAREYAKLKTELKNKYEFDRDGYTKAKSDFIKAAVSRAKG